MRSGAIAQRQELPQRGARSHLSPAARVRIEKPGNPLRYGTDFEVRVQGGAEARNGSFPGFNGGGRRHWMAAAKTALQLFCQSGIPVHVAQVYVSHDMSPRARWTPGVRAQG